MPRDRERERRHTGHDTRGFGRRVERAARHLCQALLALVLPTRPNGVMPPPGAVRNILLVRANFRIGNTVLATAWLPALRARFPHAAIDVLVGDAAAALFEGHAIRRIHVVSRRFIWAPWSFVALLMRLRAVGYDLALDPAVSGLSGPLYSWLSGARSRIGVEGRCSPLLTMRLTVPKRLNAYDRAPVLCRALGWSAVPYPRHHLAPCDNVAADAELRRMGLGRRHDDAGTFLGLFVGGRGSKRWPRHNWIEVVRLLSDERARAVVFVGPEETEMLDELARACGTTVHVVSPRPLRTFAGMLARATLLLTPDSGPMHLAVAMGVPVVPIVQIARSFVFVPPWSRDLALFRPTAPEAMSAMRAHAAWLEAVPCTA